MGGLFPVTLDTRVADTHAETGFDTRPLLERFGKDVTWRRVLAADTYELTAIPGYGPRTEERIRKFISENIRYTFEDFLEAQESR
jgi:hypothetical protein